MKQKIKNKKGFISISLLMIIITSIVIASSGLGVVLYKQGKPFSSAVNIFEIFEETEDTTILEGEVEQKELTEELQEGGQKLEQVRLEIEKARQEVESVKQEAERTNIEAVRLKAEQKLQQESNAESVREEESQIPDCSQGLIFCNHICWQQCSEGKEFVCPSIGNPYCVSKDLILCNGKYWQPCPIGQEFQCSSNGNPYCMLSEATIKAQQELQKLTEELQRQKELRKLEDKAEAEVEEELYRQFFSVISQYENDIKKEREEAKIEKSACEQRRSVVEEEYRQKMLTINGQINELEKKLENFCPNRFSEACMVGEARRERESIGNQILTLQTRWNGLEMSEKIALSDPLVVCDISDLTSDYKVSELQKYLSYSYYSSSNLSSVYQIMPNATGGYTIYDNGFDRSWTISPNNMGGYAIYDEHYNSWIAYPNGVGGYTMLGP